MNVFEIFAALTFLFVIGFWCVVVGAVVFVISRFYLAARDKNGNGQIDDWE